jgi:type IV pilus assembly protein PilW
MISLTIGLIVVGAISSLYIGSRGVYRLNESLARVQEGGRMALDFLQEDVRAAGFLGCRSRNAGSGQLLMLARPAVAMSGAGETVLGFEDGAGWSNAGPVSRVRGDVLTVRRASGIGDEIANDTSVAGASVTLKNNCSAFANGSYVALGSCDRMVVFRVTNTPASTCSAAMAPVVLAHDAAGAPGGGNGNNGVVAGPTSHQIAQPFLMDSRAVAYRFDDISFFVGANPAGRPALYRTSLGGAAEELVENVEDLDLVFGIDTSVPADGIADDYRRADAVADWRQVVSVRASVVILGPEDNVALNPQVYEFGATASGNAAKVTAADRRLRQVFSTTITLRNRLP